MSQRILIVGVSESGKSTLARKLIAGTTLPVYVRDPLNSPWQPCSARFENSQELRALLNRDKKPCIVIIDEAADFFGTSQRENHWIFTRGRHDAILPIAIGQRIKMMAPNVREQASDLYAFESSQEASDILAEAYNMPELEDCVNLKQGEFYHVRRVAGERLITLHSVFS